MIQYEYKLFKTTNPNSECSVPDYLVNWLNELGLEGWIPIKIHHDMRIGHIYSEVICMREKIVKQQYIVCDCGQAHEQPYSLIKCSCGLTICDQCRDAHKLCGKKLYNKKREKEVCPNCNRDLRILEQVSLCESCGKKFECKFCIDCGYNMQSMCDECLKQETISEKKAIENQHKKGM